MSFESMTTTFVDVKTGDEYEFLGTSIQFSERALLALEAEHDHQIEVFVESLIEDGYFDDEWDSYEDDEEASARKTGDKVEDEADRKLARAPAPVQQEEDAESNDDEDSELEPEEESESLLSEETGLSSCNEEETSDDDAYYASSSGEDKEDEFLVQDTQLCSNVVHFKGANCNSKILMEKSFSIPSPPNTRISAKIASSFARPCTRLPMRSIDQSTA